MTSPPPLPPVTEQPKSDVVQVWVEAIASVLKAHHWSPQINPAGGCSCGYTWHRVERPTPHHEHVAEQVLAISLTPSDNNHSAST